MGGGWDAAGVEDVGGGGGGGRGISVGVYRSELSVDLKQSSDSAAVTTGSVRAGAIPAGGVPVWYGRN